MVDTYVYRDINTDVDLAASIGWGAFKQGFRDPLKEFRVDIRQVWS